MDAEAKAKRLAMIREIGEKHRERTELAFAGIAPTRRDAQEICEEMDTYREERRQNKGEALTSDEA